MNPFEPSIRDWLQTVVSRELANEIIEQRRMLKKPLSILAAKGFAREIGKIPEHMREEALQEWAVRGWWGFKADWIMNSLTNRQKPVGYAAAAMNMIARDDAKGHDFSAFDNVKRLSTVAKH